MSDVNEDEILALVMPWLPKAVVESVNISTSCGCYSEYTQEPCFFDVVLKAPRPDGESDRALGSIISILEPMLRSYVLGKFDFHGCGSCCDEGEPTHGEHALRSASLRVKRIEAK